jgi:hypothetical protein
MASDAIARDTRILKECDELNSLQSDELRICATYTNELGASSTTNCYKHGRLNVLLVFLNNKHFGAIELELNLIYPRTYPREPFRVFLKNEHAVFHPLLWDSKSLSSALGKTWRASHTAWSYCVEWIVRFVELDTWGVKLFNRVVAPLQNRPYCYVNEHGLEKYKDYVRQNKRAIL